MEDFIPFDPGITPDKIPGRIRKLESRNTLLTVCVIATACIAAYYAYQYYVAPDERI